MRLEETRKSVGQIRTGFLAFAVFSAVSAFSPVFADNLDQYSNEFSQIEQLIDDQAFDLAIERLNSLSVGSGPAAMTKYQKLAEVYLETGAGIAAQTAIERARELGSDYAVTAVPFSKALLLQQKYRESLNALRGVIIPTEYALQAAIVQGDGNFALRNYERARRSYVQAIGIDDADFQAYLGLARLALRDENLEEAARLAEEALKRGPNNTMVHYTVGLLARYNGDLAKAERHYQESVRILPSNMMTNIELAALRVRESRFAEAEAFLDKVYASSAKQPMALYLSSVIQAASGNYEEADILLKQAGIVTENYLPAIYVRGLVSYELGDYARATAALEKVVGAQPANRSGRLALASVYVKQNRTRAAMRVLDPLIAGDSVDAAALSIAAVAEMNVGNVEEGRAYLEKVEQARSSQEASSISGLSSKIALAQFAEGNTEEAIKTISTAAMGRSAEIKELGIMASMQAKSGDTEGARKTVEAILTAAPQRALGYNILGTIEYSEKNFAEAVTAFTQAIDRNPQYFSAMRNRALANYNLGRLRESETDLRTLLDNRPNDSRSKAVLGRTLLHLGEAEEAVQYFKEAVRDIPNALPLLADYSRALADAGSTAQAIEQARKTARLAADAPEMLKRMGLLLLELDQAQAAERPLSRYVAYNPLSGQAHILHGRALLKAGLYTGARISFERAIRAPQDKVQDQKIRWFLFSANVLSDKLEVALEQLAGLDEAQRPDDVPHSIVGDLLFKSGRLEEAESAYRSALGASDAPAIAIGLSRTLVLQGKREQATAELSDFVSTYPDSRVARAELAEHYVFAENYTDAAEQYRRILRTGAADATTAAKLANVYLMLNNNQSVRLAERAYLLSPDDPYILDVYGWVLLQADRDFEKAIPALEKATRRAPAEALYKYHLGMAYLAQGRRRNAIRALKQALGLDAAFQFADEARRQLAQLES